LVVTAKKSASNSSEDAKKAAALGGKAAKPVTIAEKPFWRNEVEQKSSAGKMSSITYATAMEGYVVTFMIASFDRDFVREWDSSIQSLSFFDPASAREMAGPDSHPVSREE